MRPSKLSKRQKRSGVVTLEFILVAPVVFIAMIALFEFAFLGLTLQFGHAALIEGTRRGAELYPPAYPFDAPGANNDISDAVVEAVNLYLAVHNMEIVDPTQTGMDDPARPNVQIVVERNGMTATRGAAVNFPMGFAPTPSGDPPDADEVRVTLAFPLVDSTNPTGYGRPVPDWLSLYGLSFSKSVFEVSARMPVE